MAGYMPGEQLNDPDIIKLNTNENPYPPSPRVFEAIRAALTPNKLRKYPQPLGDDFRTAAGRVLGIDPDWVIIGNGSDDLLTILTDPQLHSLSQSRRDSGGAVRGGAVHGRLATSGEMGPGYPSHLPAESQFAFRNNGAGRGRRPPGEPGGTGAAGFG
jgi:hypothetical protein